MTYRGHLAGGVATAASTASLLPAEGPVVLLACAVVVVGSLSPDLDQPGAFLSRRTGPLPYLLRLLFSNPLTWYVTGLFRPARGRRKAPWYVRSFEGGLMRRMLGAVIAGWAVRQGMALHLGRRHVRRLAGHRGLSHSILGLVLAMVIFAAFLYGVAWLAAGRALEQYAAVLGYLSPGTVAHTPPHALILLLTGAFGLGYLVHILQDMMTVSGVPLLLPRSERRFWILPRSLRLTTS